MSWKGLCKLNGLYGTLDRMGLAVSYSIQPAFAEASAGKPAEALAEAGGGDGDRTRDVQLGKMAVD